MTIALRTPITLDESRFLDPDELRWLLIRLTIDGPSAWRHDPEAAELIRFVIRRYAVVEFIAPQVPLPGCARKLRGTTQ